MRTLLLSLFFSFFSLTTSSLFAASGNLELDPVVIDLSDKASLQRGAKTFVNFCLSCHSAAYMRYNRMAKDIGLTDKQVEQSLMFASDKIGDTMTIAMRAEDAKKWFGVAPPDLSVIARARGTDWLYTYLRTFYIDQDKILGTNNLVFKDVSMPHILWQQQGYLAKGSEGHDLIHHKEEAPKLEGTVLSADDFPRSSFEYKVLSSAHQQPPSAFEYNIIVRDLVNFLAYISEPSKIQRLALGKWVLLYLVIFFLVAYPLKKAFWKDVH